MDSKLPHESSRWTSFPKCALSIVILFSKLSNIVFAAAINAVALGALARQICQPTAATRNAIAAFTTDVLNRLTAKNIQPTNTSIHSDETLPEELTADNHRHDTDNDSNYGSEYDSFCSDDSLDTRLKKCWARDCSGHLAEAHHDLYLRDVPLAGYCDFHDSNFCCWHRRSLPRD